MQFGSLSYGTTNALVAILRSVCVGIAGVVAAVALWIVAVLFWAAKPLPMNPHAKAAARLVHTFPLSFTVLTIVGFAVGFGLGLRYFLRSLRVPH